MIVIADLEGVSSEEGVSLGKLIQVEEKFFRNGFARFRGGGLRGKPESCADSGPRYRTYRVPAAMVSILLAFDHFDEVEIPAQDIGYGKVGLEDAPEHFLIEFLLEIQSGRQNDVRVGVLGIEVGKDFR